MQSFNNKLKTWLATQCQMLGGVSAAMLVQVNNGTQHLLARWPGADAISEPLRMLLAQVVIKQRLQLEQVDEHHYRLAHPLIIDGNFWGVVALEVSVADKKALTGMLKKLKLGAVLVAIFVASAE